MPGRLPLGRVCWSHAVAFGLVLAFAGPSSAQSARASFFLQMLRQNTDSRVRVSAALRLQELREPDTVEPMVRIFAGERDPAVLAAMLAAFGAIGDPRALTTVQGALRHPVRDVSVQARRTYAILQQAGTQPVQSGFTSAPTSGSPRVLVGLGSVNNQSGVRGAQLAQIAQQALTQLLSSNGAVVMNQGSAADAQRTIHARHLSGHYFDANIQSLQPRGNGVRAAVSIAVSTYPGRVYEFESQIAITISGGSGDSQAVEDDAVRRAMESAANRALQQILQGSP